MNNYGTYSYMNRIDAPSSLLVIWGEHFHVAGRDQLTYTWKEGDPPLDTVVRIDDGQRVYRQYFLRHSLRARHPYLGMTETGLSVSTGLDPLLLIVSPSTNVRRKDLVLNAISIGFLLAPKTNWGK